MNNNVLAYLTKLEFVQTMLFYLYCKKVKIYLNICKICQLVDYVMLTLTLLKSNIGHGNYVTVIAISA